MLVDGLLQPHWFDGNAIPDEIAHLQGNVDMDSEESASENDSDIEFADLINESDNQNIFEIKYMLSRL